MTLHRSSPRAIAPALAVLRDAWVPQTLLAEIQRTWRDAVGDLIAAEALPVSERLGVVTVACSSATWAHELDLMGPVLLERLNTQLRGGCVTRLRCTTGPPSAR